MKCRKILCLGVAVMLVAGNTTQNLVFAQNNGEGDTVQELSANSLGEGTEREILEEEPLRERQLDEPGQEDRQEEKVPKGKEIAGELDVGASARAGEMSQAAESDFEYYVDYDEDEEGNEYAIVWITGYNGTDTVITIPNRLEGKIVKGIDDDAFIDREDLVSIELPSSLTYIGNAAFECCSNLTEISLPSGVTSIGDHAFWGCSNLTKISLPDSVTKIGSDVFEWCDNLLEIAVDGANPNYQSSDGILYNKGRTELIVCPGGKKGTAVLPSSVRGIEDHAFLSCSGLSKIVVDDANPNYQSIDGIIYNKEITELVVCPPGKKGAVAIPDSVTDIREEAFFSVVD